MQLLKRLAVCLCLISLVFGAVACEKEGTAEKAGKQLDNAFDSAKKKAEELSK